MASTTGITTKVWYIVGDDQPDSVDVSADSNVVQLKEAIQQKNFDLQHIPTRRILVFSAKPDAEPDPTKALDPMHGVPPQPVDPKTGTRIPFFVSFPTVAAASSGDQAKKFFRVRVLEREDVPWAEGGVLPETVEKMVTKSETEYFKKLERQSLAKITRAGTNDQVVYDDIESEPLDTWNSTENIQYDGHLDIGKLSSKYASDGVKGYHDALEAECGLWLEANTRGGVVANDGLYHKDHRFQVFMRSPIDRDVRERDVLVLRRSYIGLVSVKSCFGEKEFDQLMQDIYCSQPSDEPSKVPQMDMEEWEIRAHDGTFMSVLDLYKRYFPNPQRKVQLRGIAASPLFTPGRWQKKMSATKAIMPLQRVAPHKWVRMLRK